MANSWVPYIAMLEPSSGASGSVFHTELHSPSLNIAVAMRESTVTEKTDFS